MSTTAARLRQLSTSIPAAADLLEQAAKELEAVYNIRRQEYARGERDARSRMTNSPGNGDMGG